MNTFRRFFSFRGQMFLTDFLVVWIYGFFAVFTSLVLLKHVLVVGSGMVTQIDLLKVVMSVCFLVTFCMMFLVSIIKAPRGLLSSKDKTEADKKVNFFFEIFLILVIIATIRTFVFTPFQIYGPSMEDTFHHDEFIVVNKAAYADLLFSHVNRPSRGDVIVFTPGVDPDKKYLIKRVIGIPGDQIKIHEGNVFIKARDSENFIKLDEQAYLSDYNNGNTCVGNCSGFTRSQEHLFGVVPEDSYFLMGDNRQQSLDGRKCYADRYGCNDVDVSAFVSIYNINGRVALSLGHFDLLQAFSWDVSPRFGDIPNTHKYSELNS